VTVGPGRAPAPGPPPGPDPEPAPAVSVMMPAFRAEAHIKAAVASVLAQTLVNWELIIVDDGSPVPVAQTLGDLGDARIRIVSHPSNRGLPAARNTALAAARAPLIAHLDADDEWAPEYLEAMTACFDDPRVGLAYPNIETFGLVGSEGPYITDPERHPVDRVRDLARANPIPVITTVRTEAVRAVGGYATFLWGAVDYYLYLNLAAAGWRFAYVDRVLGRYRWTPEAMSSDWERVQRDNLRLLWSFTRRHPLVAGPRRRTAWLALRTVAVAVPGVRRARNALRARRGP